ncbi:MAG: hypothetical protein EX267_08590 [Acidimicrobiia bacterium]|nr:MAG: hypothetical protein EX267_08590 [Acidimicrobiia bacterium]
MARIRLVAVMAALALIASACSAARSADTTTTSTTVGSRPATTTPGTTGSGGSVDSEIEDRIDELIIEAQQLRGLEFLEPVDVVLLTDEEYQARFAQIVEEELAEEDVQAINALLRVLGIIEEDEDYRRLVETLLSAGTGGFYDPETEELVVRLVGGEFGPYAESVVVHELVHALQDQHFDLLDNEDLEGDEAYVATAVIEGDALLREVTFVQAMSLADQASYLGDISSIDLSALDSLPGYIVNSFQSAYLDGFTFHQRVGLDEIDSHFVDLPESSEQILDADSYRADEQPREVTLPDYEIPGYEVWFDAPAGQKDLELLLTDGVPTNDAIEAAQGWGGDWNRVYNARDEDAVYVLSYLGDSKADAEQLADAFSDYIDAMVPAEAYTLVERDEDAVLVIIASDPTIGPDLAEAFS